MQNSTLAIHPWTALGLGAAPFTFLRLEHRDNCCQACGTKLLNNFVIRSADGNEFVVGCECVFLIDKDDPNLAADVKAAHAAFLASQRETRSAKKAAENAIDFRATYPELVAGLDQFAPTNPKVAKLWDRFNASGKLTPLQIYRARVLLDDAYEQQEFEALNPEQGLSLARGETFDLTGRIVFCVKTQRGGRMSLVRCPGGLMLKTFELWGKANDVVRVQGVVKYHEQYGAVRQLFVRVTHSEYLRRTADIITAEE